MDEKRCRRLRHLSTVPRWTIIPTIQKQNVAEHSFHVAHIALWLYYWNLKQNPTYVIDGDILYYALIHDETEALTGDIPSPAINQIPGKSKEYEKRAEHGTVLAAPEVRQLIKIADMFEAYLFCIEEQRLGNTRIRSVENDVLSKLRSAVTSWLKMDTEAMLFCIRDFLSVYDSNIQPWQESGE